MYNDETWSASFVITHNDGTMPIGAFGTIDEFSFVIMHNDETDSYSFVTMYNDETESYSFVIMCNDETGPYSLVIMHSDETSYSFVIMHSDETGPYSLVIMHSDETGSYSFVIMHNDETGAYGLVDAHAHAAEYLTCTCGAVDKTCWTERAGGSRATGSGRTGSRDCISGGATIRGLFSECPRTLLLTEPAGVSVLITDQTGSGNGTCAPGGSASSCVRARRQSRRELEIPRCRK